MRLSHGKQGLLFDVSLILSKETLLLSYFNKKKCINILLNKKRIRTKTVE